MDNFIFYAHSGFRWLVTLATVIVFVYLLFRALKNKPYVAQTHKIVTAWSSLFGIQWLLGIILFLVEGGFDVRYRWEHATIMTLGLVMAHVHMMLKKKPHHIRYYGTLASIAVAMVLIFVGVNILPQGWAGR
jgi:multisubunit Na+/H+ antiporter MnhB subunit